MANIHPTALVDPSATIDSTARIGAFSVIGPEVVIGAGCEIGPHAVVARHTTMGAKNRVHPYASIGGDPQDKKYSGEPTRLVIGDGNTFRECVTINRGTVQDRGETTIGDDNWIMAYVHVAHDCVIGSHTIFANTTNLGGHVRIGDWAILGGNTQVHQFCQIGAHAMTGAGTVLLHDVPPYVMCSGNTAQAHGINSEGLRRRGFDTETINAIRGAYRVLYKRGLTLEDARAELARQAASTGAPGAALALLREFLQGVTRGIVR